MFCLGQFRNLLFLNKYSKRLCQDSPTGHDDIETPMTSVRWHPSSVSRPLPALIMSAHVSKSVTSSFTVDRL